ncbi:MAG: sigma-54 dependent transcriptional regulator [Thermoanaerobaculia bacterium]
MKEKLLIVDDEASLRDFLTIVFEQEGWLVDSAENLATARRAMQSFDPEVVLCDMIMPDGSGMELLHEIRSQRPEVAVIMITAHTSTRSAVEALKAGALDYIAKPFDVEELKIVVHKAVERRELEAENVHLRTQLEGRFTFEGIIGRSRRMQEIFTVVERIAPTGSTVLITGDSGTGKEMIARAIHQKSGRSGRFVSINCGAMPENLLESELFGHEKGAFTGAIRDKKGLFQEAERGTIFLDEIGEMSPPMQIKLLRVLQDRVIRRVGGNEEFPADVRVIAATNSDLFESIQKGSFREDLFYRINVIPIALPSLRQRREDIAILADHFIASYSRSMGVPVKRISAEAMRILEHYSWPGNVRELQNVIERAVALESSEMITTRSLPENIVNDISPTAAMHELPQEGLCLEKYLEEIGKHLMLRALERTGGVQTKAAELLRMSFRSFRYYAKKYGLVTGGNKVDTAFGGGNE